LKFEWPKPYFLYLALTQCVLLCASARGSTGTCDELVQVIAKARKIVIPPKGPAPAPVTASVAKTATTTIDPPSNAVEISFKYIAPNGKLFTHRMVGKVTEVKTNATGHVESISVKGTVKAQTADGRWFVFDDQSNVTQVFKLDEITDFRNFYNRANQDAVEDLLKNLGTRFEKAGTINVLENGQTKQINGKVVGATRNADGKITKIRLRYSANENIVESEFDLAAIESMDFKPKSQWYLDLPRAEQNQPKVPRAPAVAVARVAANGVTAKTANLKDPALELPSNAVELSFKYTAPNGTKDVQKITGRVVGFTRDGSGEIESVTVQGRVQAQAANGRWFVFDDQTNVTQVFKREEITDFRNFYDRATQDAIDDLLKLTGTQYEKAGFFEILENGITKRINGKVVGVVRNELGKITKVRVRTLLDPSVRSVDSAKVGTIEIALSDIQKIDFKPRSRWYHTAQSGGGDKSGGIIVEDRTNSPGSEVPNRNSDSVPPNDTEQPAPAAENVVQIPLREPTRRWPDPPPGFPRGSTKDGTVDGGIAGGQSGDGGGKPKNKPDVENEGLRGDRNDVANEKNTEPAVSEANEAPQPPEKSPNREYARSGREEPFETDRELANEEKPVTKPFDTNRLPLKPTRLPSNAVSNPVAFADTNPHISVDEINSANRANSVLDALPAAPDSIVVRIDDSGEIVLPVLRDLEERPDVADVPLTVVTHEPQAPLVLSPNVNVPKDLPPPLPLRTPKVRNQIPEDLDKRFSEPADSYLRRIFPKANSTKKSFETPLKSVDKQEDIVKDLRKLLPALMGKKISKKLLQKVNVQLLRRGDITDFYAIVAPDELLSDPAWPKDLEVLRVIRNIAPENKSGAARKVAQKAAQGLKLRELLLAELAGHSEFGINMTPVHSNEALLAKGWSYSPIFRGRSLQAVREGKTHFTPTRTEQAQLDVASGQLRLAINHFRKYSREYFKAKMNGAGLIKHIGEKPTDVTGWNLPITPNLKIVEITEAEALAILRDPSNPAAHWTLPLTSEIKLSVDGPSIKKKVYVQLRIDDTGI